MLYDKKEEREKRSYEYLHYGVLSNRDKKPKRRVKTMLNGKPKVNITN